MWPENVKILDNIARSTHFAGVYFIFYFVSVFWMEDKSIQKSHLKRTKLLVPTYRQGSFYIEGSKSASDDFEISTDQNFGLNGRDVL